jgi:hypothetical protein
MRIAFDSNRFGNWDILFASAGGGEPTVVDGNPANESAARWRP